MFAVCHKLHNGRTIRVFQKEQMDELLGWTRAGDTIHTVPQEVVASPAQALVGFIDEQLKTGDFVQV
jgi:hypothetical protein